MKWICLLALGLTACAEEKVEVAAAIVLECNGQDFDLANGSRKDASFLVKAEPDNQFDTSLNFYNWTEKRWVSPCNSRFANCAIFIGSDLITETGSTKGTDGQVLLSKMTEINRRTGVIRVTLLDQIFGERPTFEGVCIKTEAPAEEPQKF